MKLATPFCQLPFRFDVSQLAQEIAQFSESDWQEHPQKFEGNSALLLVSVDGDVTNDDLKGSMAITPHLKRCEYLQQVLASFNSAIGRTRLMRLQGEAKVKCHSDQDYYWLQRVRIHIPIVTNPEVTFYCGDDQVHMEAGSAWIFNTWLPHKVENQSDSIRIHLVIDTVGSQEFWDLVEHKHPFQEIPYLKDKEVKLKTEKVNAPIVISPWEQQYIFNFFLEDLRKVSENNPEIINHLSQEFCQINRQWHELWVRYGTHSSGWGEYQQTLQEIITKLESFAKQLDLSNGVDFFDGLASSLLTDMFNPKLVKKKQVTKNIAPVPKIKATTAQTMQWQAIAATLPKFERPIFIVSAPRSGSTFLFETLSKASVWTIGGESHGIFESIPQLQPSNKKYKSNSLDAADADWATAVTVKLNFSQKLQDNQGQSLLKDVASVRMLEKTPKNALRIPFLNAIFPDALFIYLYRDPHENVSSIMEAWQSGRFVTYPDLPNWTGLPWSMLLTPGWEKLEGQELKHIATAQWETANQEILHSLESIPHSRWCAVHYKDLVKDPQAEIKKICEFADLEWHRDLKPGTLPPSRFTVTLPDSNKWRKHEPELKTVLPVVKNTVARVRANTGLTCSEALIGEEDFLQMSIPRGFPGWLAEQKLSLAFSTYQVGKLYFLGLKSSGKLSIFHRNFGRCMGMWAEKDRLYLSCLYQLWCFKNVVPTGGRHKEQYDALYVPQMSYVTGDLDIHDVVRSNNKLIFVNTLYSCLATVSEENSFTPLWQPPFINKLAAEDRCHLNGLALRDGEARYVSAIAQGDVASSWTEGKQDAGCLIDIESNEIITTGLSMPHSPRWYRDKLWVHNSGLGEFGYVDLDTGKFESVAFCPGYLRGMTFVGDYAIVGISRPRKTFKDLAIAERLKEKNIQGRAGLLIIDLRSGDIIFQLLFHGRVEELYDVVVLPGVICPSLLGFNNQEICREISFS